MFVDILKTILRIIIKVTCCIGDEKFQEDSSWGLGFNHLYAITQLPRVLTEKVPVTTWQLITELSSRQQKKKVIAANKIGDMKISPASEMVEAFTGKNQNFRG